ncbi:MAG: NAD-dependent deacetylase [Candidatus Dadabacteria bacterium]|nr:NAD-dependent deacetylase [Candidatus Dadabacteria bacterium]
MTKDVIDTVIDWIKEAKKIVAITGAELSAESGLPDFTDPKINPHIDDFRAGKEVRANYWKKIKEMYLALAKAQPNPAHEALVELEMMGRLDCLFTQTTDGLHHRAGHSTVIELNSTMLWVTCTNCGKDYTIDAILSILEKGIEVPVCEGCGKDVLKPPISFPGQPPPHWEVREAWMMLHDCDLLLIIGASLDAQPVSSLPTLAKEKGAKLVIISEREGQADDYADAVIYGKPSHVLPHLLRRVKEGIELS